MANMFWISDKISKTLAIYSGFRLCPIISHSSMRRTIPVAFIYQTPPAVVVTAVSIRRFPAGMQIHPVVSFGKGEDN